MKVSELLTDESKWTQGARARDKDGNAVSPHDDDAVAWSIDGAVIRCYIHEGYSAFMKRHDLLQRKFHADTAGWNDSSRRTFEQIIDLAEELGL